MSALTAEQEVWWRAFELAYRSRLERGAEPTSVQYLREAAAVGEAALGYFKAQFGTAAAPVRERRSTVPSLRLGQLDPRPIPREEPET